MSQKLLFIIYVLLSSFLQPIQAEDTVYYPSEIYFEGYGTNSEPDPSDRYIYKKIGNCIQFKFIVNTRENYFINFTNEDYKKLDAGDTVVTYKTSNIFNFIGYDTVRNYYQSVIVDKRLKSQYFKSEHVIAFGWPTLPDFFIYYGTVIVFFLYLSITNTAKFLHTSKLKWLTVFIVILYLNYAIVGIVGILYLLIGGNWMIYMSVCFGLNTVWLIYIYNSNKRLAKIISDIDMNAGEIYSLLPEHYRCYILIRYITNQQDVDDIVNEVSSYYFEEDEIMVKLKHLLTISVAGIIMLLMLFLSYMCIYNHFMQLSYVIKYVLKLDYINFVAYSMIIVVLYFVIDKLVSSFKKNV